MLGTVGAYLWQIVNNKWFWYIVGGLALFFIIRKNWWKIKQSLQPKNIELEEGETMGLSDKKKNKLEKLAEKIRYDIYDTPWTGHNYTPYEKAIKLTDQELAYLAEHYESYLADQGNSLYDEIKSQYYTWGSSPARLKSKLQNIGVA